VTPFTKLLLEETEPDTPTSFVDERLRSEQGPRLLVEWSSPWDEFRSALAPAMSKSPRHLAGEAPTGLFPYRGMLVSWICEAALLVAIIVIPAKLASMHPYDPPPLPKYDVIYYSGDELPRTEDAGGAQTGRAGRAGGQEAHNRIQAIRVARGDAQRTKVVDAPRVKLPRSEEDVANLLAYKAVPGPPPAEGLRSLRQFSSLSPSIVPPTPNVARDKFRSLREMQATVIAPPPAAPHEISSSGAPHVPAMQVVPPPVSAPEQITNSQPKLMLPASVIAPPPQITAAMTAPGRGSPSAELNRQVVPPPVQLSSGTGLVRQPVSGLGKPGVVPPPVQLNGGVPVDDRAAAHLGSPHVVPPPADVNGLASGLSHGNSGLGGGSAVVPPPPTVSAGISSGGHGTGRRGAGLGGSLDAGLVSAPPTSSGNSNGGTGVVISTQPGSKVGIPGNGGSGSLAMSPAGTAKSGVGGNGGGASIGHGNGPGSGFSGEGSGASKAGTGHGSDTLAKGGISPYPGSGGAGSGTAGKPAMPGVTVRGGNSNIITLPSFGSNANEPTVPGHSSLKGAQQGPDLTIVATARSGGALNFYGALKGDLVYTIYLDTSLGTVAMQYADPTSTTTPYSGDLTAPHPLRSNLPAGLRPSRLIVACILDRSGMLKNVRVLEPGASKMTAKVLAALPNWKFTPVLRGNTPVEVNAILGFDIDTR
jgi:hypothetical protein